ncbi:MAG: 8-oxoguanine DNA glycosylase [Armatimonadetes bacterium]|nr:8-oxoguanine DNA glycosylase [Armatimonadota bacterium]MDE2207129.1 8-oxoguanine DNA glycosylase [Armatimonadota bacterium]
MNWNSFCTEQYPLDLPGTLAGGQAFRWRRDSRGTWWGVIGAGVAALREQPDAAPRQILWQTFPERDDWPALSRYLRLDEDLHALYASWRSDEHLGPASGRHAGLRILRQPPLECLFAFQCAAANTVVKIERTVARLAERYGERIVTELTDEPWPFYAFPTPAALAEADEGDLRADLWGYRAPRVIAAAHSLLQRDAGWLDALQSAPWGEARTDLMQFFGIGRKIADCIALFGLGCDEAVPVDTHILRISIELLGYRSAAKSLTPTAYQEIGDLWRRRYGNRAGWAQQYLFLDALQR